jgi:hypothetical protein
MRLRRARVGLFRFGLGRIGWGVWVGVTLAGLATAGEPGTSKSASRKVAAPTYCKDVAPILQKRCQNCHRKGEVGPFALGTYQQARKRAEDIASVVEDRQMPPWKPAPGIGPKLRHDKSLPAAEVSIIRAWADAGAPQGDPKDLPPELTYITGWALGTPDLILEPSEDYQIPAAGPEVYRCFVIPTNLRHDVYITAVEFRPGNRSVVHHMGTFIDVKGNARRLDQADPGPGYTSFSGPGVEVYGELGFWSAGNGPQRLPEGVGLTLPRGSDVILQIHYHCIGKPETDRTRLGLHLARKPIKQAMHWNDASNQDFRLPAGRADVEICGTWFVPVDVQALAVAPHMHQLGRDVRMSVTFPGGRSRDLIHIPDWDPGWQSTYFFEKPIDLPKGSIVKVLAHFDNSTHPRNPHQPPKLVRSGFGIHDEMCIGYIAVVKKGQDLTLPGVHDDLYETFEAQRHRNIKKKLESKKRSRF